MISFSAILIALLILMLLGTLPHLASQQKLGLWPERRTRIDCGCSARPAAHGTLSDRQMPG
jgi:hypothetical protein